MIFKNREDAGRQLAEKLTEYKGKADIVVLGLARGGVVLAAEIAKELKLSFDAVIIRKLGTPGNEELAMGAVAEKGEPIYNQGVIRSFGVTKEQMNEEIEKQRQLIKKRKAMYLKGRKPVEIKGKVVILTDDGIATGASMKVAIESLKAQEAKKIVLAIPVAAPDSLAEIKKRVDETICLSSPTFFQAVGEFYREFGQTSDEEVIKLLAAKL